MKRLRTHVSLDVENQILDQVLYIAQDSIRNALAWEARLRAAINGLAELHSYAVDEDASDRVGGKIQKLVFERTYLIHFYVDHAAGAVVVVNFRHGARLPRQGEP